MKKEKIDCAFILEKTKAPAIACKIAKIDKIYGFGIGSQKFFVDSSVGLSKSDLRYNLTHFHPESTKAWLSRERGAASTSSTESCFR